MTSLWRIEVSYQGYIDYWPSDGACSSCQRHSVPDSKVHGANMGPTWVISAPDGPHIGPMNLAIRRGSPGMQSDGIVARFCSRSFWWRHLSSWGPSHQQRLTFILACIVKQSSPSKVWDEIIYPFLKFNDYKSQDGYGQQFHVTLHMGCNDLSSLELKFKQC